jgi:hypothetical protein
LKKVGYGLDEEIIQALKHSPRWIPGKMKDTPVKTEMLLPVSFTFRQ